MAFLLLSPHHPPAVNSFFFWKSFHIVFWFRLSLIFECMRRRSVKRTTFLLFLTDPDLDCFREFVNRNYGPGFIKHPIGSGFGYRSHLITFGAIEKVCCQKCCKSFIFVLCYIQNELFFWYFFQSLTKITYPDSDGKLSRSRIHKHTILLKFLDIILRVLRIEVSVYITNQFQTTFYHGGRGGGSKIRW
jgi:hypothetical protein